LFRSAGYEARAAFDGQQALDLLRIEHVDLLVVDYNLRGFDGLETLRRLRKQSSNSSRLPVVMLLPRANDSIARDASNLSATSFVIADFDPATLLETVRNAGHS
jgi:DNA-binding response OmpR family regulator